MIKQEDRLGILLEEMRSNFKLAFEKIDALGQKLSAGLENVHSSLKQEISVTAKIFSHEIKDIDSKLEKHMRQPAHA
ncbi:MAG: hypothetical protein U9R38_06805 [Candidatus Margulisiibacteriota bacterium]|nr:hypothetical protein [Candidatus Margulisiibacteriota bacterium]